MSWPSVGAGSAGGVSSNVVPAPARIGGSFSTPATSHTAVVPMAGERGQRARRGERGEVAAIELRAMGEVGHVRERLLRARRDDARAAFLLQSADHAQAEAQGRVSTHPLPARGTSAALSLVPSLQRAIPFAHRDVDVAHFDAVPARVLHELRGRVEAHRLRVEKRARRTPRARRA